MARSESMELTREKPIHKNTGVKSIEEDAAGISFGKQGTEQFQTSITACGKLVSFLHHKQLRITQKSDDVSVTSFKDSSRQDRDSDNGRMAYIGSKQVRRCIVVTLPTSRLADSQAASPFRSD